MVIDLILGHVFDLLFNLIINSLGNNNIVVVGMSLLDIIASAWSNLRVSRNRSLHMLFDFSCSSASSCSAAVGTSCWMSLTLKWKCEGILAALESREINFPVECVSENFGNLEVNVNLGLEDLFEVSLLSELRNADVVLLVKLKL